MSPLSRQINTAIIPSIPAYYDLPGKPTLDFPSICIFVALGFFLDDDTFFINRKAYKPATQYEFDGAGALVASEKTFHWHYTPRGVSFSQTLEEFTSLFERIVAETTAGKHVIVPISGGLDSRTLAAAVKDSSKVSSYSYELENGPLENKFGKAVARAAGLDHRSFIIPRGYLWGHLPSVARINQCYSDFINPRQIAVLDQVKNLGEIFLLGHWGDVLFDDMGVGELTSMSEEKLIDLVKNKILKPSGLQFARLLWAAWDLPASFDEYINGRLGNLLGEIKIDNLNARIRAFKSLHWAPRWTSSGISFFNHSRPVALPYYHDEICKFVCTVPEEYLSGRRIQIEYLKAKNQAIAKIPWQKFDPCNLYTYDRFDSVPVLVRRALGKSKRILGEILLHKKLNARNWELQFLGQSNDASLKAYLFESSFSQFVPKTVTEQVYGQFLEAPARNAHAVSMLLTLSLFNELFLMNKGDHGA